MQNKNQWVLAVLLAMLIGAPIANCIGCSTTNLRSELVNVREDVSSVAAVFEASDPELSDKLRDADAVLEQVIASLEGGGSAEGTLAAVEIALAFVHPLTEYESDDPEKQQKIRLWAVLAEAVLRRVRTRFTPLIDTSVEEG